ncbi:hypothetical protein [Rasiella rasia]|uniref:hypothetical protein n=1 Tax=Rasiella rasia TaxID=2744027 RepID=UPI0013DFD08C|nr:hypothetical protein [Rasiella rasia]
MNTDKDKIPNQEKNNTSVKDSAIDEKANVADGREINHQVKDKREKHQPRDNA